MKIQTVLPQRHSLLPWYKVNIFDSVTNIHGVKVFYHNDLKVYYILKE